MFLKICVFSENPYWLWLTESGERQLGAPLAARLTVHVSRLFV